MVIKNNSDGKPYFSQRNNKIKPASSCNVTSIINALSSAGWPVQQMAPAGIQPEDSLMHFIMTDASCGRKWRSLDPEGKIPPNEWHAVLAYGANKWLAKLGYTGSPVQFRENVTAEEIKAVIQDGGAAVVSGYFPSVVEPGKGPRPFTRITDEQFNQILCDSKTKISFIEEQ